jgi:hypothetical protein
VATTSTTCLVISLCYYPGWVQRTLPPDRLPWDALTHVAHFGRYPLPDGSLPVGDMQSESQHAPLVAAARNAGRIPLLTVGGGGSFGGQTIGANFAAACASTAGRARLVADIAALVVRYGYDGADIDWEEAIDADAYVALLAGLRTALGGRRMLTTAVVSGLVPGRIVARTVPYVDLLNVMSYWSNGADQIAHYRTAGVPAAKLVVGAGFSPDPEFADSSPAAVRAKVAVARAAGAAGVMFWQAGDLTPSSTTDPRLQPLREAMMPTTYPGCRWYPLGAQTENRQTTHNVIILHTMVGYLVSTDNLFRAGNGAGFIGLESHFGVGGRWGPDLGGGYDGAVWQWQDLDYQAQASGEGNGRAISIETADNAPQLPGDIEAWTPAQVDAIVKLVAWLCRKYGIPARLVGDTRPGTSGIAYHAQGTAVTLPAGAERWSPTVGKPCPTARRINQITGVVIPRVQQLLDQGEDDMTPEQAAQLTEAAKDAAQAAETADRIWRITLATMAGRQVTAQASLDAQGRALAAVATAVGTQADDEVRLLAGLGASEQRLMTAISTVIIDPQVDNDDPDAVVAALRDALARGTKPDVLPPA